MTIGIGVFCESFQNVILAADCRGSYADEKLKPHDEMGKQFALPFGLYADIAGVFAQCEGVIASLTTGMMSLREQQGSGVLLGQIREQMRLSQAQELRFRFEDAFPKRLGITLDEYKQTSNPKMLRLGRALMRATPLAVALLVAGFTEESPVLLSALFKEPPEIVSSHETIGSGSDFAMEVLDRRGQNPHYSCQRTILHIAEALEAAKLDVAVGPPADYIILQKNGLMRRLKARDLYLAQLIEKYKNQDTSALDDDQDARIKIKNLIYEQDVFTP